MSRTSHSTSLRRLLRQQRTPSPGVRPKEHGARNSRRTGGPFVSEEFFTWKARQNAPAIASPRKRLKIPDQAFGPSFKYGRLTNPSVRARFKEFFVFMDGPRRYVSEGGRVDEVGRFRVRFLLGFFALLIYSLFRIFGSD
jgi:hypothetical protein